jgi:hypothetical protein
MEGQRPRKMSHSGEKGATRTSFNGGHGHQHNLLNSASIIITNDPAGHIVHFKKGAIYIYAYMYALIYINVFMNMYICIFTYIYTYISIT